MDSLLQQNTGETLTFKGESVTREWLRHVIAVSAKGGT